MNTRRIHKITKQWLALVVVLALLSGVGIATAEATLDEQLMQAAKALDLALVKSLLNNRADLNGKCPAQWTALTCAASKGRLEIVRGTFGQEPGRQRSRT